MKDEDSDLDLPDDRDSDSAGEENRPFRPRSMKGMMVAGTGIIVHESNSHNERCDGPFHPIVSCLYLSGRDTRVIGTMQGGDSDEVSSVTVASLLLVW